MRPIPAEPDPKLRENLWAAAAMVTAAAAVVPPPPPEPVSIVQVPAPVAAPSAPSPEAAAKPSAAPATVAPDEANTASPYRVPAHIAAARQAPDPVHWIMFGSAAAFLGIVWIAIFFGLR